MLHSYFFSGTPYSDFTSPSAANSIERNEELSSNSIFEMDEDIEASQVCNMKNNCQHQIISFLCFYHFTRPPASPLCLQPINFHFICCMTYKFYNGLQLGMYNSQCGFFLKNLRVRGNSWTITILRDLHKPILACFFEIVI